MKAGVTARLFSSTGDPERVLHLAELDHPLVDLLLDGRHAIIAGGNRLFLADQLQRRRSLTFPNQQAQIG